MIKVMVGNNLTRKEVVIDESKTLRGVLEDEGIDYTRGSMHLDGAALYPGDLDRPFADFNIKENCYLLNVAKADNGARNQYCFHANAWKQPRRRRAA